MQDWISIVFIITSEIFSSTFSNNHFNRRKHFPCFVSCIYHCMLLLFKVCVYVVQLLFKEIQTSGFECYDSKWNASNEHYVKKKNLMLTSKKTISRMKGMAQKQIS